MTPEAERFNGWAAMLGFVAAVGAYKEKVETGTSPLKKQKLQD